MTLQIHFHTYRQKSMMRGPKPCLNSLVERFRNGYAAATNGGAYQRAGTRVKTPSGTNQEGAYGTY